MLKQIGAEQGQDVVFGKILILFQTKPDGTSETIVCDRIAYCDGQRSYYVVSMGAEGNVPCHSSLFMSVSNLEAVFAEVKRVVREY